MSLVAKSIDACLKEGPAPLLKSCGFKKTGRTWRRSRGDAIQVVNVQLSQGNLGSQGKFTINLGLYYPSLVSMVNHGADEAEPHEYHCHLRARIAQLQLHAEDHWWQVDSMTVPGVIGASVRTALESQALPWLDDCSQLLRVTARVLNGALRGWFDPPWACATLLTAAGAHAAASAEIDRQLASANPRATIFIARLEALRATLEAKGTK